MKEALLYIFSGRMNLRSAAGVLMLCACAALWQSAAAQAKVTSALIRPDTVSARADSLADSLQFRSGQIQIAPVRPAKSGNLAMLFSAVVPGAGQVYAHRYYTIPLIWGFGIYFYREWSIMNSLYHQYRNMYTDSVKSTTITQGYLESIKSFRDQVHDNRDEFAVYLGLTYILNIIDAYVGATLYGFDVSDDLGGTTSIRFRIPIH